MAFSELYFERDVPKQVCSALGRLLAAVTQGDAYETRERTCEREARETERSFERVWGIECECIAGFACFATAFSEN
jgi:hypothetical protein